MAIDESPLALQHTLLLGFRALSLELFGKNKEIESRATGFVVKEDDGAFLYTCWHVVTGVDFLDPSSAMSPPSRDMLVVSFQDVQERQPGVQAIGGIRKVEIPLYDEDRRPRWLQESHEREHADLNAIGIRVPKFNDVVRLPIDLDPLIEKNVAFLKRDIGTVMLTASRDVIIVGYPHGYSSMGVGSPESVFIKRSIASNRTEQAGVVLLDGPGAPGMSGAPIIATHDNRWWLFGIYTGSLFPDHLYRSEGKNDRFAALGMMTHLYMGRAFMGVPGLFNK